ncbi:hypothetical protein ACKC9G_09420 [Pokkaliibacter sp. CJK22405]|uniref:hypothetical protein n=1 Tax=Pokkaliibacter sp. CJK22405 TaxID=3384615 RepID=UPI00398543D8
MSRLSGLDLASRHLAHAALQENPSQVKQLKEQPEAGTLDALEKRLAQLREKSPAASSLKAGLDAHLHQLFQHQRAIGKDWAGHSPYVTQRQDAIERAGGLSIARQYGITLAENRDGEDHGDYRQLHVFNATNSTYNRITQSPGTRQMMRHLYLSAGNGNSHNDQVFFANSMTSAQRVIAHAGLEHKGRTLTQLAPGLVSCKVATESDKYAAEDELDMLGGRPSASMVMSAYSGGVQPIPSDSRINNQPLIKQLRGPDSAAAKLHDIPKDHGRAALSHTAALLLEHLGSVLDAREARQDRQNPVLNEGLKGLLEIADRLPSLHSDATTFANGFHILCEELQVCLASIQAYNESDMHDVASKMLKELPLPAGLIEPTMHLASSGMGALNTALDNSRGFTGQKTIEVLTTPEGDRSPVYYEQHMEKAPRSRNLFATLNISQPGHAFEHKPGWGVKDVISALDQRLKSATAEEKPLVLTLDATLEVPGDLKALTSHFSEALADGSLSVHVCKSFQKYANLCSGKVVAGGVGVLTKDDTFGNNLKGGLEMAESLLEWSKNPDMQLMTHLLECRDQEMALVERSVANANFVADNFFTGKDGHQTLQGHDRHLPFLSFLSERSGKNQQEFELKLVSTYQGREAAVTQQMRDSALDHLSTQMVNERASFGFAHTTFGFLAGTQDANEVRLSFGQETQAELTELFYMPSRLMNHEGSQWSASQAAQHIFDLVKEGLKQYPMPPQMGHVSLAERLIHLARAERTEPGQPGRGAHSAEQLLLQGGRDRGAPIINKIASVMLHLCEKAKSELIQEEECKGPDRQTLDHLLQAMIQSGMPGVSGQVKDRIATLQSELLVSDMTHGPRGQSVETAKQWLDHLERLPSMKTNLQQVHMIPEDTFNMLDSANQLRCADLIVRHMDDFTRFNVVNSAIRREANLSLTSALLSAMERDHSKQLKDPARQQPTPREHLPAMGLQLNLLRSALTATQSAMAVIDDKDDDDNLSIASEDSFALGDNDVPIIDVEDGLIEVDGFSSGTTTPSRVDSPMQEMPPGFPRPPGRPESPDVEYRSVLNRPPTPWPFRELQNIPADEGGPSRPTSPADNRGDDQQSG